MTSAGFFLITTQSLRGQGRKYRAMVVGAGGRGRVASGSCGFGPGEIPSAAAVAIRGSALAGATGFVRAEFD